MILVKRKYYLCKNNKKLEYLFDAILGNDAKKQRCFASLLYFTFSVSCMFAICAICRCVCD